VVTAFIGDLAELLGCVLSIPDELTAITLVAFGTSLPDTFASKTAAVQDEYADASVGNVTGSNAVNVLLGLGLPWSIGSIYWAMNANNEALKATWMNTKVVIDGVPTPYSEVFADLWPAYIYPAGDLSFSVGVYCGCACLCVILLTYRRWKYGGELGGPGAKLVAIYLVLLWSTYIGLSAWRVL
jgi:solute carrier family 8 (sodium/calcium exchanger)